MTTRVSHLSQGLSESNQLISAAAIILRTQATHDLWANHSKLPYNLYCLIPSMCNLMIPCSIILSHNSHMWPFHFDSFIFNFMKSKLRSICRSTFHYDNLGAKLGSKACKWRRLVATDFICRKFTFNASRFESSIVSRTCLNFRNTLYRKVGQICFNSSSDQPNQLVRNCTSDGRRSRNG